MKGILMVRPLPIVGIDDENRGSDESRILTPSPREIWVADGQGYRDIHIDLGSDQEVDCFFVGGTNADEDMTWRIYEESAVNTDLNLLTGLIDFRLPDASGPQYAGFYRLAAPVTSRWFMLRLNQEGTEPLEIGTIVAGKGFDHAYAFGNGRIPIDTSRRERLIDGGFGIEEGVTIAGFRWKFVDLGSDEEALLWSMAMDRGLTKPLIVVENGDVVPPPAASVHYCVFQQFEAFEREDPNDTTWALSAEQWA